MKKAIAVIILTVGSGLTMANPIEEMKAEVYKSPYCGCCEGWIDYANKSGIKTQSHNINDLNIIKEKFEIPKEMQSCHTIEYKGLVFEGHVPVEAMERAIELSKENSEIYGVSVPGMPMDSPGMNGNSGQEYDAFLLLKNKEPVKFMTFKGLEALK